MAVINGQALFEAKRAQWAGQGSDNRFPSDYVRAVNSAVDEYCQTLEETIPARITSVQDDIQLSENVEWIISLGIDRWIAVFGNFRSGDLTAENAMLYWDKALTTALHQRDTAQIAAAVKTTDTATAGEVIGAISN